MSISEQVSRSFEFDDCVTIMFWLIDVPDSNSADLIAYTTKKLKCPNQQSSRTNTDGANYQREKRGYLPWTKYEESGHPQGWMVVGMVESSGFRLVGLTLTSFPISCAMPLDLDRGGTQYEDPGRKGSHSGSERRTTMPWITSSSLPTRGSEASPMSGDEEDE